jgi:hypothetical protein
VHERLQLRPGSHQNLRFFFEEKAHLQLLDLAVELTHRAEVAIERRGGAANAPGSAE